MRAGADENNKQSNKNWKIYLARLGVEKQLRSAVQLKQSVNCKLPMLTRN